MTGVRQHTAAGLVWTIVAVLLPCAGSGRAEGGDYDPLAVNDREPVRLELTVSDAARSRDLPILVYLPAAEVQAPVVLFSHGLGGSRHGNAYLGRHWSGRGYVAVFLQHPGSDASVWKNEPVARRMAALRRAANLRNSLLRAGDVTAVLDQLTRWNEEPEHPLRARLDLDRIGMSGHSFGAVTTQAVSGQRMLMGRTSLTDSRIRAALAFSPSSPRFGDPEHAFGQVAIPWMLMTGTHDTAPIGRADVSSRLAVFPALPEGGKYELVLSGAAHSAFSDRKLPGDTQPRNPNHHRAIVALSTAFWDAWLGNDPEARNWLDGPGARTVLEEKDRWRLK